MQTPAIYLSTHDKQCFVVYHLKLYCCINTVNSCQIIIPFNSAEDEHLFNYLNTHAKLTLSTKPAHIKLTGTIHTISGPHSFMGRWAFTLILSTPPYALTLKKNTRYFNNTTMKKILATMLADYPGLNSRTIFTNQPQPITLISQNDQTDFAFLSHLCKHYNLSFGFCPIKQTLFISDSLLSLSHQYRQNNNSLLYTNTNQISPATDLFTKLFKKISLLEKNSPEIYCLNATHSQPLQPGYPLFLNNCPSNKDNGNYIIQSIKSHITTEQGCQQRLQIRSSIQAIKTSHLLKQKPVVKKCFLTPLSLANIASLPQQSISPVNAKNRYFVTFQNDSLKHKPLQGSPAFLFNHALSTSYSACYSPLQPNTPVIIQLTPELKEKAFILGTLYKSNFSSPVTTKNASQHVLQTPEGHQLIFDDQHHPSITLSTANKNSVQLQNQPDSKIHWQSQNHLYQQAKNRLSLNAADTISEQSHENLSHIAHKNIAIKAKNTIQWQSQHSLHCLSNNISYYANNISIYSNQSQYLHAKQNISFQCQSFNAKCKHTKLQSEKSTNITSVHGPIHISCGAASITLSQDGQVSIDGTLINLYGLQTEIPGT